MFSLLFIRVRFFSYTDSRPIRIEPHPLSFINLRRSSSLEILIDAWHDQFNLYGLSALNNSTAYFLLAMILSSAKKIDLLLDCDSGHLISRISFITTSIGLFLIVWPSKA